MYRGEVAFSSYMWVHGAPPERDLVLTIPINMSLRWSEELLREFAL